MKPTPDKAREMKPTTLLERIETFVESDYHDQHRPPGPRDGAPLHDITSNGIYPSDAYDVDIARFYGVLSGSRGDMAVASIIRKYRGQPDKLVTIYRAVPLVGVEKIRDEIADLKSQKKYWLKHGKAPRRADLSAAGDQHYYDWMYDRIEELEGELENAAPDDAGEINDGDWVTIYRPYAKDHGKSRLKGDFQILSKRVRAKQIFTDGNSFYEWGYHSNA